MKFLSDMEEPGTHLLAAQCLNIFGDKHSTPYTKLNKALSKTLETKTHLYKEKIQEGTSNQLPTS